MDRNEYNEADLITVRVPLSLPYQNDTKDFERITGEIKFNGKIYKYVKRRIENGEFILLCLPDKNKMHIEKAKADFFQNTNDVAQNNTTKKPGDSKSASFKKTSGEYDEHSPRFKIYTLSSILLRYQNSVAKSLLSSPHLSPEQPPDSFHC